LGTLNRIVEAHVRSIPFENLDILLGKGVSVELPDIERKLVHQSPGGYCFEQNTLLQHVLLSLGYQVQPLSARVRPQVPREFIPPRTHLFLRVELEGQSWLVDVSVGSMSLTSALCLARIIHQPRGKTPRIGSCWHFADTCPRRRPCKVVEDASICKVPAGTNRPAVPVVRGVWSACS
jgi:N-hydroxyarylamine O-acetyltransferase